MVINGRAPGRESMSSLTSVPQGAYPHVSESRPLQHVGYDDLKPSLMTQWVPASF